MKQLNTLIAAVAGACIAAVCGGETVLAFGTTAAQGSEHERITRHALSCQYAAVRDAFGPACFEHDAMNQLAGHTGSFGAVGAPDRGALVFKAKAHCDDGDYMDVANYPQSRKDAREHIWACRRWMLLNLNEAVTDAGAILKADGTINGKELGTHCTFVGREKNRAKCNVIEDLGLLLHASEDFYSHSNWTDVYNSPPDVKHPPGLGHDTPAPLISFRGGTEQEIYGLMTGCFTALPESWFCHGHVKHDYLNKDKGEIFEDDRPDYIGSARTDRGIVNSNFQRAVRVAVADTQDKWRLFQEKVLARYGQDKGGRIVCAIVHDKPLEMCDGSFAAKPRDPRS